MLAAVAWGVLAFLGLDAALAKDCMIPPEAPRLRAGGGFFEPDGTGVDSLEPGFRSATASSLTCAAGACFEAVGLVSDALETATLGLGTVPWRSLRRTYGFRIGPRES